MMTLRCTIDGLLLFAHPHPRGGSLVVHDGDESFNLECIEALHYELVSATVDERLWLERTGYRLLRPAADFRCLSRRTAV